MRVKLQRRGWPHRRYRTFDKLVDRFCLSPARRYEHQMARFEDGADSLSQAVQGNGIHIPAEESSVVPAGLARQCLDASS
jgi:hypothetical protein